ncbi:DMT family transporter [Pseudonocardia alni]|uniref:DMT family transporter n=1 Tax=Pseudonocardia alni TaxID=33907 RepID=UPI00280C3534|nr:DMT family transporter [Pseudonocardia alni]
MADVTTADTESSSTPLLASASVLLGALCLSVSAVLVKFAAVDAATTAMLRCAIAVPVLIPLAILEHTRRGGSSWRGAWWAIVAGVALGIDYAAWTAAIYHVGAGISTVLINVQVIVLPLLALLVDRERIATRFLVVLPLMLLGIGLVGGLWGTAPGGQALTGTLLGLLAGLGYGIYLFLARRATRQESGCLIRSLAWSTSSAAVTTTVIAPFSGGLHLADISARSWLLMGLLAVSGQVIAWLLVHYGSTRLAPTSTAALLLVQPVLALGLAALTLSEYPTPFQLTGAMMVVAAVAIANGLHNRLR